ncbi:MAG TPA: hypothetical protein VGE50_05170 [Gammaproteobacteria bacterium]
MKKIITVLSAFAISATTPLAPATETRASTPVSVTEYFLTCTPCETDMEGSVEDGLAFRKALLNDDQATYYLNGTPEQPRTEYIVANIERIVDPKNGYISISGVDNALGVTYTGAIFVDADRKRIFAWTYEHEGGESDAHEFQFFESDGMTWQDISKRVLPAYSIKDFAIGKTEFGLNAEEISWEIVLPRYGTTAYLIPHPSYEMSEVDEPSRIYNSYIGSNHALELRWDKKGGKFIKGKLLDLNSFNNALKKIL